ncbi:MAG: UDP-glucuronic acid decarboxylase family protein [Pseudomonadota bacterium]|nr:UDP-glucuronic acid decarboxylase family protein [Pseudomonadota bacterium]MEE3206284.1 UDP-glucuronic acid decarboxylase family protein [Pseudomonadota bacterium]
MNSTKKILVTGGAGFLGSHLCERLMALGHSVVCVDNFFTGTKSNIKNIVKERKFTLIRHDIIEPINTMKIDQIYNLACPASPVHYQHDPVKTVRTNVQGSINVLNLAKKYKLRIFQASTSEVYGDPKRSPQKEKYRGNVNPIGPRACYDEGKRCAETLFFDYQREFGVNIRVARIFNTYGPRMHPNDGRVVSNFIMQALKNSPITIYGDGTQTRAFCYVDDMIAGIISLMNKSFFLGPVNLGNPREITILELAETIINLIGSKSKLVKKNLPIDDPLQRCPDIMLARKKLQWKPKVNLKEGLVKTINYLEKFSSKKQGA